jgi:hypothetical protein
VCCCTGVIPGVGLRHVAVRQLLPAAQPDGSQGHSKISILEVPLATPQTAQAIAEPAFELLDYRGTPGYRGCHDISVFLEIKRAASACMGEGQIWDISNPADAMTIGHCGRLR